MKTYKKCSDAFNLPSCPFSIETEVLIRERSGLHWEPTVCQDRAGQDILCLYLLSLHYFVPQEADLLRVLLVIFHSLWLLVGFSQWEAPASEDRKEERLVFIPRLLLVGYELAVASSFFLKAWLLSSICSCRYSSRSVIILTSSLLGLEMLMVPCCC